MSIKEELKMLKAYAVALILTTSSPVANDVDGAKKAEQSKQTTTTTQTQARRPGAGIGF